MKDCMFCKVKGFKVRLIMNLVAKLYQRTYDGLMMQVYKRAPKIREYKKNLTANATRTGVIKHGVTLLCPTYKKYYYCDKDWDEGYFFRYKPVTEKGKYPVIIYLHGHGLNRAGMNNMQLFEFSWLKKNLNTKKCHQVAAHLDISCEYNRAEHSRALDGIIDYIQNTYKNVDFNRIYLAGTSHGGYGCVYEVLRNPDKYAAAVISMAYTFNELVIPPEKIRVNPFVRCLTDEDYKTLAKTPFFLSWAKNDTYNMVMSNELLLKNLQANNANVQFEIYDDGGHTIASKFYKKPDWLKWMFELSR